MSTILYSSCFLEGNDKSGSPRFLRTLRWARFYNQIRNEIGASQLFLLDNGSSPVLIEQFCNAVPFGVMVRTDERLYGNHNTFNYPYCWRAIHFMRKLILMPDHKIDKIVFIDTDGFVLSKEMADYIKNVDSGWISFDAFPYDFPMSEFHILCKDTFEHFLRFTNCSENEFIQKHNGDVMERVLPFTRINRDFVTGRFGESRAQQTIQMDFYSQAPIDIPLRYQP